MNSSLSSLLLNVLATDTKNNIFKSSEIQFIRIGFESALPSVSTCIRLKLL